MNWTKIKKNVWTSYSKIRISYPLKKFVEMTDQIYWQIYYYKLYELFKVIISF